MKYLIAVDSSDNSRYAFSQAKKRFFTPKDHVYILTVTESPTAYPFEDLLNFSSESYTEMNRKIEQMYAELLKKYGRKLTKASVPHTCLLARGTIKDVICRQAQDLCVDVVIMGRRGLGKLERTFIGSTSQYCVHNLNCSVMVIPLVQDENVLTKSSEEIAREISKEEESECKDEEHESKFKKIGQYEREKWGKKEEEKEFPKERLSEPVASDVAEKNVPIKSEGKKNKRKKNKNNQGNIGKSAGKWEDVTLKSKEELPTEPFPITDEELKEQKKKLIHEEGTIDVIEKQEEKSSPKDFPIQEKKGKNNKKNRKRRNKGKSSPEQQGKFENLPDVLPKEAFPHVESSEPITGELLKEQKAKLIHEEGTIDVIGEEEKEISFQEECKGKLEEKGKFEGKGKGKDVSKAKEEVKPTFQEVKTTKKNNRRRKNKNKGKSSPEQQGKFENLPDVLPKEAFPHVESSEPITGELLKEQKAKLIHEEGTIDVIEEDKEYSPKHSKDLPKESKGKFEGKSKEKDVSGSKFESKFEGKKEGAKLEEPFLQPKKNKRRRNKNKGKNVNVNVKETKEEFPSEELPKEPFPITDEELKEQKKKLIHEEGTIDVIEAKEKEFSPKDVSKESKEGKFKGKTESKLEKIKERISGGESPKEKEKEKEKHERGAGKFEKLKESISGGESPKESKIDRSKEEKQPSKSLQEKECNDPLCNNKECPKHGTELKKGPKWQGKVHEKKECNDPKCNNSECPKHGKKSKEEVKGVVPQSEKSFAEVVSSSVEKGKESPKIIEKSEHKAAINIGEGKIEGKIESKKDEEGKWKGSIGVGYKGKDEKGQEYEGKHYEASVQSTK